MGSASPACYCVAQLAVCDRLSYRQCVGRNLFELETEYNLASNTLVKGLACKTIEAEVAASEHYLDNHAPSLC